MPSSTSICVKRYCPFGLKDTVLLAVCQWISVNLLKCWNAYIIRVTAVTIVKGVFQIMEEGLTPINRKYFVKIIRNTYMYKYRNPAQRIPIQKCQNKRFCARTDAMNWVPGPESY